MYYIHIHVYVHVSTLGTVHSIHEFCFYFQFPETLPDFISTHTTEKLCLPCLLRLPKSEYQFDHKTVAWMSHDSSGMGSSTL